MSEIYRLSQKCCGNICGTKTVNQKFENNQRPMKDIQAQGIHAHWIALIALLLIWIFMPNFVLGQSCSTGYDEFHCGSGTSTGSYSCGPVANSSGSNQYSYCQMIYLKDELCVEGGTINAVSFYNYSLTFTSSVDIYMANTNKTKFEYDYDYILLDDLTLVYSGNVTFTGNAWTKINLSTPFDYAINSNLVVAVNNKTSIGRKSFYRNIYSDARVIYKTSTSQITPPNTIEYLNGTSTSRAQAKFCIDCNEACTPRTGAITFADNPLDLLIGHSSSENTYNNNIVNNSISPTGTIHFTSSNPSVATVDGNTGIVTAVSVGSATITAIIEGDATDCEYFNEYTVNVTCVPPTFQWTETSYTANQGTTSFPSLISNHPQNPTYTSSSTGVATINSSGVITIRGTGTTTVTASVPTSGDTCSATASYTLRVEGPCTPSFDDTRENYYIRNFTATGGSVDINNTSLGTANSYSDYYDTRNLTTLENTATTISFSITAVGGDTYGAAIWVDYNNDGVFADGERVWHTASAQASPITGSFTVPASATRQEYRMRVALDGDNPSPSNPCNIHQGEVEDYKIITPVSDCATPTTYNSNSYHIDTVRTTGGIVNINNPHTFVSLTSRYENYYESHYVSSNAGSQITVRATFNSTTASNGLLGIWVDWNNDGTFENPDERMYISGTPATSATSRTISGSFTIPSWVQPGEYRMRLLGTILLSYFEYPCGNSNVRGEYEDYKIVVTQPTLTYADGNCSGTYTGNPDPQQGYGYITLSPDVPSCSSGNTFAGWNTMSDGSGQFYQPNGTYYLTSDATLYAIFQPECCVPSNAIIQYTHGGKTDTAQLADDGYFYYDLCKGETLNATLMNIPGESCGYSNHQWRLDSVGTVLETSTASSFNHTFNAEYGYNFNLSASSTAGCTLAAKGRVRVSGGIHSLDVSNDHFSFCPGNVKPVTIGYEGSNSHVTVNKPGVQIESTLGHSETIFLPDGIACDVDNNPATPDTCAYISSVTFSQFSADAVVRDYNDILYVHINMEHSWMGDLYIAIECPNGQRAAILNYGGSGTSACNHDVPSSNYGWTGTYTSSNNYRMGIPSTTGDWTSSCTPSEQGTGWNYAWSNNDNHGYTYAGGNQGFVYNTENCTYESSYYTVDSTDMSAMTQVYHPEESFANLVGCPLNGDWKIIVIDGWNNHNGYLFEWDLALSEDLMPENWGYTVALDTAWAACNWSGGGGAKFNNFTVEVPTDFAGGDVNCVLNYIDEYGCETNDDITLHFDIGELSATVTPTNATCGRDNGQIAITSPVGEGPFTYSLNGGEERSIPLFTGLAVGHYTVRVRDSRDCYTDYEVDIENEGNLAITGLASTYTICEGSSVTLSASSSGGTGTPANYTWLWSPATGLSATNTASVTAHPTATQTYTVTVTDEDECQAVTTVTVTVNPRPSADEITITHDRDYVCNMSGIGLHTGSSTATGGASPYTYEWGTDIGTISSIPTAGTEAAAGWGVPISGNTSQYVVNYWLIVTDANGCKDTSFTSVDVYPLPQFSVYGQSPHCLGESVDLSVLGLTGGTPPYNDANWQANNSHAGLPTPSTGTPVEATPDAAGTYTYSATVTDSKGCGYTANVNITFFDNPSVSDIVYTPPTCHGGDDGSIAVTVTNVAPSVGSYIEVQLNGEDATSQSGNVYTWSPLSAGTYTLDLGIRYVTGSKTCNSSQELTLTQPEPVVVDATSTTPVCLGGSTTLTVTNTEGGAGAPYTYTWTGNGLSSTTGSPVTATPADATGTITYTVTAEDANHCPGSTTVNVFVQDTIDPNLSDYDTVCVSSSEANNEVTFTAAGTTTDYEYAWTAIGGTITSGTGTNNITVEYASEGTYTVTVTMTDKTTGCVSHDKTVVTVYPAPEVTIADPGTICPNAGTVDITGSTSTTNANYTYVWSGDLTMTPATTTSSETTNITTATIPSTPCEKTYDITLTVTDGKGCKSHADRTVTVSVPNDFNFSGGSNSKTVNCTSNIVAPHTLDPSVMPTVTDGCNQDISSEYTLTTSPDLSGMDCEGTVDYVYTYTDCSGHTATWTFSYTVDMPAFDVPEPGTATVSCPSATDVAPTTPTVLDQCNEATTVTLKSDTGKPTCEGTRVYTYTYKDCANNSKDWTYTYNVEYEPFTIETEPGSSTVACINLATMPTAPAVKDNCNNDLTPKDTVEGGTYDGCEGIKTYTFGYEDCEGNRQTWTYTYTIERNDFTMPDPGSSTVACISAATEPAHPTVNDNCDNVITNVTGPVEGGTYDGCEGAKTYTWTYTDCEGNHHDWVYTYTIEREPFTISTEPGSSTVACINLATMPTAPAVKDNCNNDLTPKDTVEGGTYDGCEGTKTYTFGFEDCEGNRQEWVYTYTIERNDFSMPDPGSSTVACISAATEPAHPTVNDNCGNVITNVTGPVEGGTYDGCEGTKTYTWTYTDCEGNHHDWVYTYTIEREPFTIETAPGSSTVACINLATMPTAPAVKDNCNNDLTPKDTVEGGTYDGCEGTKTYTFGFEDCEGNRQTWTYTYTIEREPFSITAEPGSSTVACINLATIPTAPAVKDNCNNDLTPKDTVEGGTYDGCEGTKTYTFGFEDCEGNRQEWVYTYTIERNDFSMPDPGSSTVACISAATEPAHPTVNDNCGNVITNVTGPVEGGTYDGCEGTKTYTWTYTDCEGNHHDWVYTYTIEREPFTISTEPGSSTVACINLATMPTAPAVKDNCNNDLTPKDTVEGGTYDGCEGTKTYTFGFEDCEGNRQTWTYTYTIEREPFSITAEPGSSTVACINLATIPTAPAVKDNCNNDLTPKDTVEGGTYDGCEGTKTYTFGFEDCEGNRQTWTYTYTIEREPFSITAEPGSSTVACINLATIPTAPAVKDNCNNDLTPKDTVEGGTYDGCEGTKTYTFGFEDCEGNRQTWTYTYTIEREPFSITAEPGSSTVACINLATIPTAPAVKDNCNNDLTPKDTVEGGTYDGCEGTKTYTFGFEDCEGNRQEWVYTYTIERSANPTEDGSVKNRDTVACLADATAPTTLPVIKDQCQNILTPDPATPTENIAWETGKEGCVGTKTYTYNYKDCDNRPYQWVFTYVIKDTIAPELTGSWPAAPANQNTCIANAVTTGLPSNDAVKLLYTDCSEITVTSNDATEGNDCNWTITRTYTITDECGNTVTPAPTMSISGGDNTNPELTGSWPDNITGQNNCVGAADIDGLLSDNDAKALYTDCSALTVSHTQDTSITGCNWTITRTYTITDACSHSVTNTMSVSGTNKVELTMSSDTTICLGGTANLRSTATVCSGDPTYLWTSTSSGSGLSGAPNTNNISVTPSQIGDMVYNDTAYDANGCKVVESITVHVNDTAKLDVTNATQTVCQGGSITPIVITYDNATINITPSLPTGLTLAHVNATKDSIYGEITGATSGQTYTFTVNADNANDCGDKQQVCTITISARTEVNPSVSNCGSYHWVTANEDRTYTATIDTVIGPYTDSRGCDSITNLHVEIYPLPNPTMNNVTVCLGESATLTVNETYSHYVWSNGVDRRDSTVVTSAVGETTYTVHVTDANGCEGDATAKIIVNEATKPVIAGRHTICNGDTDTLTTTTDYDTYTWTGNDHNDTLFVTATGDYTVTTTDANGCSATSDPFHVEVLDPITITENSKDTTYCYNETADSLSFTAHGGDGNYTYQWQMSTNGGAYSDIIGANDTAYTPNTNVAEGTYTYRVSVDDGMGCGPVQQVIATITIRPAFEVTSSIAAAGYCEGGTATTIGVTPPTGGAGSYTYQWAVSTDSVAYSNVSTDSSYTPATATAGTYYYRITVTDSECGDTTLHVQTVNVWPHVGLDLVGDRNQVVCVGGDIDSVKAVATAATLPLTVTIDPSTVPFTYNETTGNIGFTTVGNANDVITVTVTAHGEHGCGDSTLTFKVTLSALTEINKNVTECGSYNWTSAAHPAEDETFDAPGSYDRTFGPYPAVNGCDSTTNLHVVINANPTPVITGTTPICLGDTAVLTTTEAYDSYEWNNSVSTRNDTIVPTASGSTNYTVTVTDGNRCSGTSDVFTLVVNDTAILSATNTEQLSVCQGGTITPIKITYDHGTIGFEYNGAAGLPAGLTYNASDSTITGTPTGVAGDELTFTIIDTNTNCGNKTVTCTIKISAITAVNVNVTECGSYTWTSTAHPAEDETFNTPNTYDRTFGPYTAVNGCDSTVNLHVVINANPTPVITGNNPICLGDTSVLTTTVAYDSYDWSNSVSTANDTIVPTTSGSTNYTVTVTDGNGCSGTSDVFTLVVNDTAILSATNTEQMSVCQGGSITPIKITYDYGTIGFEYNGAAGLPTGLTYNASDSTITGSPDGVAGDEFTFTIIDTNVNCGNKTVTCTIKLDAVTAVNENVTACGNYSWTSTANPTENETFNTPGSYDRTFGPYTAVNGCDSIVNLHVVINDNLTPTMDNDTVCVGSDAHLTVNGSYAHYVWGNGVDRQDSTITTTIAGETTYTVHVTDANGCSGDATAIVVVRDTAILSATNTEQLSVCQGGNITPIKITYDYGTIGFEYNSAAGLPAGLTYNASDSTITGAPAGIAGDEFSFTIIDTNTNCGNKTVTCTIKLAEQTKDYDTIIGCGSVAWTSTAHPAEDSTFTVSTDMTYGPYTSSTGCDSTTYVHVVVNANPTPVINGNTPICLGDTAVLTTTEAYATYDWNNSVSTRNDTIVPTVSGSTDYTVTVTDGNGCSGTSAAFTLVVNDTAILSATNTEQLSVCQGGNITPIKITYDYGTIGFEYNSAAGLPAGLTYNASDSTITGTPAGVAGDEFTFTIIDTNTNCGNKTVTCTIKLAEQTKDYDTIIGCGSVAWTSTAHPAEDSTFTVSTDMTYGPYTSSTGCDSTTYVHVVVNANPTPVINGNTPICLGDTAVLTTTEAYATYDWNNSVSTRNDTIVPTVSGSTDYTVTVTDGNGCSGTSAAFTLVVNDTAILSATNTEQLSVCQGGNITPIKITYDYGTIGFEYNSAAGLPAGLTYNASDSTITGTPAGVAGDEFTFTIIDTNTNCGNKTVTCTIKLAEQTKAYDTIIGCGSVAWTSTAHPEEDSTFTMSTDMVYGPYTSSTGCDSTMYVHVNVNGGTTPVFSIPDDVCVSASLTNDSIEISVQALTGYTYAWTIDGGIYAASSPHGVDGVSDTNRIVVRWVDEGDKSVSVTLTNIANGCDGTATKTIHVHPVPGIAIAAVVGDICPHSGSVDLVANLDPTTTADYTYDWGGEVTVATTTPVTNETSNTATATIPTTSCDTTYNVGVSVVDGNGCKAVADSVTLVVRDMEAPTFTRPADDTIYKNDICEYDAAVAETGDVSNLDDNCTAVADLTVTHTDDTIAGSCYGATIIRRAWRVTDLCGNISDAADSVQTITVLDTVAPVIAGPMNEVNVEGCDESAVPAVSASDTTIAYMQTQGVTSVTDNCSDEAHLTVSISDGAMTGDCDHQVIRTYTVTDDCGNSSSISQTININRPAFMVPAIDTVNKTCENEAVAPTSIETVTLCGETFTAHAVPSEGNNRVVTMGADGYLYVTYNYQFTDCKGDYDWHMTYRITPGEFTPEDSVYTTVACPSDIPTPIPTPTIIVCNETVPLTFAGVTTSDTARCGDSIYNYTYEVNGTTYHWAYIVRFTPGDFTMPTPGTQVVTCPSQVVAPNTVAGLMPEVQDACGNVITDFTLVSNDPIPTCDGDVVYTYRFVDCAGHSHDWTYTYTIEREDFTVPVPGSATVACAAEAVGAGESGSQITLPTVMPACSGEAALVPTDTIEGTMPQCEGEMTYTYVYEDCAGHTHNWVFTYNVKDSIAPTIVPIADRMADAAGGCQYMIPDLRPFVNATDNCGETHILSQTPDANTRYDQTTSTQFIEVVLVIADDCGNEVNDTVILTVPARNTTVSVNPNNPSICYGESVTLNANGQSSATGESSYRWNPVNGLDVTTGATVTANPTATTTYTVTFTDGNGCEASASTIVTVNPQATLTADNLDQEVCVGGSITNIIVNYTNSTIQITGLPAGLTYRPATSTISGRPTASGEFTIRAISNYGCPTQELTGMITIADTVINTTTETACDYYVWSVTGGTYSTSGRYRNVNTASDGCISVDYINLTINTQTYGIEEVSACDSYTWTNGNGQTYTNPTNTPTYTIHNGNAAGCDSTTTLHLTMHYSSNTDINESGCDSFTWYGTTYTNSTEATHTLPSRWGCDSTLTLHLTINPSYHFDTDLDSICRGETYYYHGSQFIESGVYPITLHTRAGCDSVYTLGLTVLDRFTVEIEKSIDCITGTYTLTAISQSENYRWSEYHDHGQVEPQATQQSIEVAPPATTTYTVTVGYGPDLTCPQSASISVDELITPTAQINTRPNHLSYDHPNWYADDASEGETDGREWYVNGEYYSQQSQHIDGIIETNPYGDDDSVTLMLIVHSDLCSDTAEAVIPMIWSELWVPNVFTPSLDHNNLFGADGVGIIEYEIWIYTREGLRVFHSTSMDDRWDGKHEGTDVDCKQEAYTYRINYRFASKPEELQTKVGLVLLLR